MRRQLFCLLGSGLILAGGGTVLAGVWGEGFSAPPTYASGGSRLAQAHQHEQQESDEDAPPGTAPPPSPAHRQGPPQVEQPAPERQQQMMMPGAPTHDMPGMDMEHRPAEAEMGGHDMSPVDVKGAPAAGPEARGGRLLQPTVQDGIKQFELSTGVVRWHILPDVEVGAYAYNGQVPGPLIRVQPHDRIRVRVRNDLPNATTVHWHGLILPIEQDGVPEISQPPIEPGREHVYEFEVPDTPGTYFYHTHFNADRQQPLGLYGALIIDDPEQPPEAAIEHLITLGEWTVIGSETYPAMPLEDMLPNYFTFNGKSYPATETVRAKVGDRILFRLIGSGQFIHPIHIHGGPFEIVATDGNPVPGAARLTKDTVLVGPGERYDIVWTARRPGKWLLHCHINHHITNDGAEVDGGGGMTMIIDVTS